MFKNCFFFLLFFVSLVYPVHFLFAQKSDEYITYAVDRIYKECSNSVLKVENSFLSYFPLNQVDKNGEVTIPQNWRLKQPSREEIHTILTWLERWHFPDNFIADRLIDGNYITIKDGDKIFKDITFRTGKGEKVEFTIDGRHLFSCNNNFLDIKGDKYIWGEEVIELPRYYYETLLTIKELAFVKVVVGGIEVSLWQIGLSSISIPIIVAKRKSLKFIWQRIRRRHGT